MNRKSLLKIAAAAVLLAAGSAQAQINVPFTVNVTFTPRCQTTSAGPYSIDFAAYSAFDAAQAGVALTGGPITVQCSRGLTVTAAFDNAGAAEGLFSTGNLRYTLSGITQTTLTTGVAATASTNGTADTYSFAFTGGLPQQAGNSVGGALTASRNLVVSF
jgi:hypothetical protein